MIENLIKAVAGGGGEKQSALLVQILTQLQNWWQQACLEQGAKGVGGSNIKRIG